MNLTVPSDTGQILSGTLRPVLLFAVMLLACLSVTLFNGEPFFYYDSAAYVDQGGKILERLGLFGAAGGDVIGGVGVENDNSVNGSRSAVYSVLVASIVSLQGLQLVPYANTAVLVIAAWLVMRATKRGADIQVSGATLVSVPLLVACAGSLPFYVAFVMPDIMAPVLILMIAILAVFGQSMGKFDLFLAFTLGALAVVSHISHIAIAAVMVPLVALIAYFVGNRRWWLSCLLVILMVIVGVSERMVFKAAAKSVASAEVVYIPFLTARLIEDGPGLRYLTDQCPRDDLATCLLHEALSKSDDPMRLTASHIIFETKPDLGSFRFLSAQEQARVAGEQYRFFFQVLAQEPVGTLMAILRNTAIQSTLFSVDMTIPTDHILKNTHAGYGDLAGEFSHGRLSAGQGWLPGVTVMHSVIYATSLAVLGLGLVWRAPVNVKIKALVIAVLFGIAVNAFVCGAVSQPASRYGARVIWLLPYLAAFQLTIWIAQRRRVAR